MKLPNASRAVVDIEKLRNYCLSANHPRGRHKARVFETALGMTAEHSEELREAILSAVLSEDAVATEQDEYGQRYFVDFTMERQSRKAEIRSAWIIRTGEDYPRLTSCYVL
jgi:ribosomal protein L20